MEKSETVTLFRPGGEKEIALIRASGWKEFPERLPDEQLFCPLLTVEPATRIARETSTQDGGTVYVLRFNVDFEYLKRFPIQAAGWRVHQEYWIPADQLAEFNGHIIGLIEVISEFHAPKKEPKPN
jgi:hypothetical protein